LFGDRREIGAQGLGILRQRGGKDAAVPAYDGAWEAYIKTKGTKWRSAIVKRKNTSQVLPRERTRNPLVERKKMEEIVGTKNKRSSGGKTFNKQTHRGDREKASRENEKNAKTWNDS